MDKEYIVRRGSKRMGRRTEEELRDDLSKGHLLPTDFVRLPKAKLWTSLRDLAAGLPLTVNLPRKDKAALRSSSRKKSKKQVTGNAPGRTVTLGGMPGPSRKSAALMTGDEAAFVEDIYLCACCYAMHTSKELRYQTDGACRECGHLCFSPLIS